MIHIRRFQKRVEHGRDQQKSDKAASVYMLLVDTVSWLLCKETESCLCKIISQKRNTKMSVDFNIEEENLLYCILSDLFHAPINVAPV